MINYKSSTELVEYSQANGYMKQYVEEIIAGKALSEIWFLQHQPVYTAGRSALKQDLLEQDKFPVFAIERGGQYTYHGPGQRVVYLMLDLKKIHKTPDVRKYVTQLEQSVINALAVFNVTGYRISGKVGIWVDTKTGTKKIAAIGIKIKKWVAFHGICVNINPDLSHYNGIVPCGISNFGVTSMHDLGHNITMQQFDEALKTQFNELFTLKN